MTSTMSEPVFDDLNLIEPRLHAGRIDAVTVLSFYLLLLMVLPADLVFAPIGAAGGPATLFGLLVFLLYLGLWLRPGTYLDRGRQPIRVVGVLFTCAIVASYASANRHVLPVLEKNAADRGLMFVFGWLGVLLLAADGIDSTLRLRILLRRQVLGATVMAVVGAIQFAAGTNLADYIKIPGLSVIPEFTDLLTRGAFIRPFSTASHPIEFGAVLVMSLPLALHQARFAPRGKRVMRWLQVGVILLVAPMTVSRSAIIALAVVGIVLLPTWTRRERRWAYGLIAAAVAAIWVVVPGLVTTLADLFLHISSDPSAASRTKAIGSAWGYVAQNPWLGRGFGTFQPATYFFVDDQYISSIIATGIIGLLALVMIFVAGWLTARSARRRLVGAERRHLAQCLAASIAVAAVSFSNYDALSFPMASGLTFLLLGCCGAYWRLARQGSRISQELH
jgi:polysaccharide biosynthesis protein PslJ